jgi:predicted transcriptional regulator
MGVVANYIARFESGKVEPTLSTITKFVKALGGTCHSGRMTTPEPPE